MTHWLTTSNQEMLAHLKMINILWRGTAVNNNDGKYKGQLTLPPAFISFVFPLVSLETASLWTPCPKSGTFKCGRLQAMLLPFSEQSTSAVTCIPGSLTIFRTSHVTDSSGALKFSLGLAQKYLLPALLELFSMRSWPSVNSIPRAPKTSRTSSRLACV